MSVDNNEVAINTDAIKEYLLSEYHKAGVKNLQIDAVMGAIETSIKEAIDSKTYDEELRISKNISIDCFNDGRVSLYIDRPELLSTKDFENVFSISSFSMDKSFPETDVVTISEKETLSIEDLNNLSAIVVDNNQLRQKLLQKHDYYARYCNNIKTNLDLLLSKEDIKKGLHKDTNDLHKYEVEIIKNGIGEYKPYKSIKEERVQINYYYNLFVMAMTSIIDSILFEESKFRGFHGKRLILENLSRLKDATIGGFYSDKHKIPNFFIASEWNSFKIFTLIESEEHEGLFGSKYTEYYYVPKENPTIQEMLEWMDVAENTLQEKREKLAIKEKIKREEEEKEREKWKREWKEGEPERKKKQELEKKRQAEEQLKIKNEQRQKEFEYNRQLKLGNRILILFFTALTAFVSYLAVGDGRMQEETFQSIRNLAVIIAIPLMISIYYYTYRYKYIPATNNSIEDKIADIESSIKSKYSRQDKLKIFGIGLFLIITIVFDYTNLFYILVALIFVYGIYQAYRTAKNIDTDKILFEEDVNIKDRIKKAIGTHIDIPYYGFEKVSDSVVDEVYHFFKDKKTEVEVAIRKIKESEVPYETMDDESLVIMTEKHDKYDKLEKDGFAELQKIKAYGTVLERVLKEG